MERESETFYHFSIIYLPHGTKSLIILIFLYLSHSSHLKSNIIQVIPLKRKECAAYLVMRLSINNT